MDAPNGESLRTLRDKAILATLLYHALRREELCKLKVKDFKHERRGVPHLKVSGKGGKTRYVPLHPAAGWLIHDYLELAGHGSDEAGALFRPVSNNTHEQGKGIMPDGVYKLLKLERIPYGQRRPPTRSIIRPTSPRCRNGLATPTSPRHGFTTTIKQGLRIARCSR